MITIIILLTLLAIKDEIVGFVDLYSTLQGNKVVYMINTFITCFTGYMEMWFLVDFDSSWTKRIVVAVVVSALASCGGCVVLHYKKKLKSLLRRKRISKGMITHWQKVKQQPKEEITNVKVQPEIKGQPINLPQETTDNNERSNPIQ